VLGVDPSTIESEWRAKIRRSPAGTSWTSLWKEIKAHGCE
jgi:hypothetical protein